MSHDFAKQRAARANRAGKPPASPWLWFASGLVAGVFCSFLVFLTVLAPHPQRPQHASGRAAPKEAPDSDTKPGEKPQFDFYTLLPESEVIVGERPSTKLQQATEDKTTPRDEANPAASSTLLLQAGSFRKAADADRRRGEIILLGYEAKVENVSLPGEGVWYRVQVGPFPDARTMTEARQALSDLGFDTLEISRRGN